MAKQIQRHRMGTAVYLGGVDPAEIDAAVAASPAISSLSSQMGTHRDTILYADEYPSIQDALYEAGTATAYALGSRTGRTVQLGDAAYEIDDTLTIPTSVTLRGVGERRTVIMPSSSFPTNTPLIRMGTDAAFSHGCRVEALTVNCNNVAGSVGIYSDTAHEPASIDRVVISRFGRSGIRIRSNTSLPGMYPGFFRISDVEVFAGTTPQAGPSVDIAAESATLAVGGALMERVTINGVGASAHPDSIGLNVSGAKVVLIEPHFEKHTVAIDVELGTGNAGQVIALAPSFTPTVGTGIRINDSASFVGIGVRGNPTIALIANAATGESVTSTNVGFYTNRQQSKRIRTLTSTYTEMSTNSVYNMHDVFLGDATAGAVTVTLPYPPTHKGQTLIFKKIDSSANKFIARRYAGYTVDGVQGKEIGSQWGWLHLLCDGTQWLVVGQGGTITDQLT